MGLLDGLLSQVTQNVDIKNLAEKVGISPEQAESAVAALGQAHPEPGDTVESAAASTGLSSDVLQQIVSHIGGEGALGQFSALLSAQGGDGIMGKLSGMLDRDGDGNPLNDLSGLAGGLFGKK
ncbi:hypothetical protein ASG11_12020 [Sphingomonas sp. Leaf357]|uniref:hypothetical protein n=1 Tax=Sphingomonas sp. Leaf357 TaxID=1736350 RepID=UPI0006FF01C5|nr:hypothetical protein [Sphingomonas sp. Leaf357]KQS04887.1 hypothetical protein ASG11_12020 [Sphingomonas sp. Leaf357]